MFHRLYTVFRLAPSIKPRETVCLSISHLPLMQKAIWILKTAMKMFNICTKICIKISKNSISTKRPTSSNATFVLQQHSCSKKTQGSYLKKKLLKLPAKVSKILLVFTMRRETGTFYLAFKCN